MEDKLMLKVKKSGYYYSPDRTEIIEAIEGDTLPYASSWEYIGDCDMTRADIVSALQEKHPDVSIELSFRRI